MKHLERAFEKVLASRLKDKPIFIQAVMGPRQVGKTSGVLHVLKSNFDQNEYLYFTAEESLVDSNWFIACINKAAQKKVKVIVFDEIQKLDKWSELIKLYWDRQKKDGKLIHWVILGSSSLKLSQGLGESLAGRFEMIKVNHWSYHESSLGFKISLDKFISKGGYPGGYLLLKEDTRFKNYILNSIFESVINQDILRFATVKKPALFRQTFILASQFPAQEISYNKLLGQLQEAGNVDQIKYYLDLFSQAYLIKMIFKWGSTLRSKTSSPKLLCRAPVFSTLFYQGEVSSEFKGRIFESIVGNRLVDQFDQVFYWRENNFEVDFVTEVSNIIYAIEVKSQRRKTSGLTQFQKIHQKSKKKVKLCIIDLENFEFFDADPQKYLEENSI